MRNHLLPHTCIHNVTSLAINYFPPASLFFFCRRYSPRGGGGGNYLDEERQKEIDEK
jgi:hypothetical protein